MKSIGPTFADELKAAGLEGLPFSWDKDGNFTFNEFMTETQKQAVLAIYEAHDPAKTVLTYQGTEVRSKADVDAITKQRIVDLGEEKAKTEKLIAGTGECILWDAFVTSRATIIADGDAFVTANNLT